MNVPSDLKYTNNDEWIRPADGAVGITDHAQEQLSDIVFVEILVAEGDQINQGDTIASVESVKAAADVYAPASGTVTAINEALSATPELINKDAYGEAWMLKLEISDPAQLDGLLDAEAYGQKIAEG